MSYSKEINEISIRQLQITHVELKLYSDACSKPTARLAATEWIVDIGLRRALCHFCQVLTIIPGSPKRILGIPSRTSMKIDHVTPRATTHNGGILFALASIPSPPRSKVT
jgi:hypothetical protein